MHCPGYPFPTPSSQSDSIGGVGATNQHIAAVRGVSVKAVEKAVHRPTKRTGLHGTEVHAQVQLA